MRTSLNEIQEVENFLLEKLPPQESLLFQAKLITNPMLKWNVALQSKLMDVVLLYHRRKLKVEIRTIHNRLFSNPDKSEFQLTIDKIFNPQCSE